jgi:hypothetical protein
MPPHPSERLEKNLEPVILAHWHQRIANFNFSTTEFYARLRAVLEGGKYPGIRCKSVDLHEAGPLSAKRAYFRISREGLDFDICAAPFGKDYFVSWWLLSKDGCAAFLGVLAFLLPKKTYYQEDTAIMFRETIHGVVVGLLADILPPEDGVRRVLAFPDPTVVKSPLL